jgi:hypothetical protein
VLFVAALIARRVNLYFVIEDDGQENGSTGFRSTLLPYPIDFAAGNSGWLEFLVLVQNSRVHSSFPLAIPYVRFVAPDLNIKKLA